MASAANNEAYGNPPWGSGPQGQAWGNPGWGHANRNGSGGGDRGWGNQGWQGPGWVPPFWTPIGISKPMALLFTVLGFIFWWPVGLAILLYMVFTGRMGSRGRAWQMTGGPTGGSGGWQQSGPGWASFWKQWCGPSGGSTSGPSSGNHAFDEYKAETLRRLEEEQKEFAAYLDRLRFAKDKSEFDQFMSERRQRPPAPQQDPSSEQPRQG